VTGANEGEVLRRGGESTKYLIRAVRDPRRWIAAHVLLSILCGETVSSGEDYYVADRISPDEWNHLRVDVRADGSVGIDASQRDAIEGMWTERASLSARLPKH
jgi:hypothetical protein